MESARKNHKCEKLKGQVRWREDLQYWVYISEEGRWVIEVKCCPICKQELSQEETTAIVP